MVKRVNQALSPLEKKSFRDSLHEGEHCLLLENPLRKVRTYPSHTSVQAREPEAPLPRVAILFTTTASFLCVRVEQNFQWQGQWVKQNYKL